MALLEEFQQKLLSTIAEFSSLPSSTKILISLFALTFLVAVYALFIWKFHRFLAKKNIFNFEFSQYNSYPNATQKRIFSAFLYFLEYLIVLPFLISFWFVIFSLFLIFLSKIESIETILLISSAIVASIRLTSYFSEELSRDLAKVFPLTLLVIFLVDPNYFNINALIERIVKIPELFNNLLIFLVFIFILEAVLRFFSLIYDALFSD